MKIPPTVAMPRKWSVVNTLGILAASSRQTSEESRPDSNQNLIDSIYVPGEQVQDPGENTK